jgi:hypothetical protein
VLLVLSMVVLLGMAALVVDVGMDWYAKRQLQAAVDAAALAGAQNLPDPSAATATASSYLSKNTVHGVLNVSSSITTKCVATAPGCTPANAIVVSATATSPSFFARVMGFKSFTVGARATACQPCGGKKLDIMVVLDRTGSMSGAKITNAKAGIQTLMNFFDPGTVNIGLTIFEPAPSIPARCAAAPKGSYNDPNAVYVVVPLSNDYKKNGVLDPTSNLVSTVNCIKTGDQTAYAAALNASENELNVNGRPDAMHVIVFLTDGAANTGSTNPCADGVVAAANAKGQGTRIYSIGYNLSGGGGSGCTKDTTPITPTQALTDIASTPSDYYFEPGTGTLDGIFSAIAADIGQGASRLVDNGWG